MWDQLGCLILCCEFVKFRGVLHRCWAVVCSSCGWHCWHLLRDGFNPSSSRIFLLELLIPWGFCSTLQQSCSLCCLGCQRSSGPAPAADFGFCWRFWLLLEVLAAARLCQAVVGAVLSGFMPPASCWLQPWDAEPGLVLPSPALWRGLSCQELLEETQILRFFTGSGAKLTGEFKVEALCAKSSSGWEGELFLQPWDASGWGFGMGVPCGVWSRGGEGVGWVRVSKGLLWPL